MVHNKASKSAGVFFAVHFGLQIEALQYNYGKEAAHGCLGRISFNFMMGLSLRFKNTAMQPERRSYSAMAGQAHEPWHNSRMNRHGLLVFALFHRTGRVSVAQAFNLIES